MGVFVGVYQACIRMKKGRERGRGREKERCRGREMSHSPGRGEISERGCDAVTKICK